MKEVAKVAKLPTHPVIYPTNPSLPHAMLFPSLEGAHIYVAEKVCKGNATITDARRKPIFPVSTFTMKFSSLRTAAHGKASVPTTKAPYFPTPLNLLVFFFLTLQD